MSKLLSSVLDRVSESNNEYRSELRSLNNVIDEKVTALVGDIVTLSSYTADFSNTISSSKEKLVNPIARVIENYVIKDLRSVETVNEQFVEKINDKIENANIESKEEKDKFIENLNVLLNEKYLEIVKIKRVNFLNESGSNQEVEKIVDEFIEYLKENGSYDGGRLLSLFVVFKSEMYKIIAKILSKISSLYLSNFVDEVSNALGGAVDFDDTNVEITDDIPVLEDTDNFKPFMPEMNPVPEIDIPMQIQVPAKEFEEPFVSPFSIEVPNVPIEPSILDILEVPEIPEIPSVPEIPEIPEVPEMPNIEPFTVSFDEPEVSPMQMNPIAPIEIVEESKLEKIEVPKRSYDVEEILKIAKSPIVTMPMEEEVKPEASYVNVVPISRIKQNESLDDVFNEREIVEELIGRLTKRLQLIDERHAKYEEEKKKLDADENFVNDLIQSSSDKKQELDQFETSLDEKEKELDKKKKELDKKIKNVMPFANAVLNNDKES